MTSRSIALSDMTFPADLPHNLRKSLYYKTKGINSLCDSVDEPRVNIMDYEAGPISLDIKWRRMVDERPPNFLVSIISNDSIIMTFIMTSEANRSQIAPRHGKLAVNIHVLPIGKRPMHNV